MAVEILAGYEEQTPGGGATTGTSDDHGDSAMSSVSAGAGGTILYASTHPAHGSMCLEFTQATAGNTCYVQYSDSADDDTGALSQYFWLTGSPSTTIEWPGRVTNAANSAVWSWQLTSGRLLRISAGSSAQMTTAPAINTLYRWESQWANVNSGSGTIDMQLFLGNATSPLDSIGLTGLTLANVPRHFRLGRTSTASALAVWYTDSLHIVTGDDTPLGPYASTVHTRTLLDGMGIGDVGQQRLRQATGLSSMGLTDTLVPLVVSTGVEGWGMPI